MQMLKAFENIKKYITYTDHFIGIIQSWSLAAIQMQKAFGAKATIE